MKPRTFLIATVIVVFSGVVAAAPADPQLLNLVMPDAKLLAGVNVQQAKATPFGLYVLSQMQTQDNDMQQLTTLTGFDPRRDVTELLVASNGAPGDKTGLALARGTFDIGKITAAAIQHGATSETYKGVTILEDPHKSHGIAFLSSTLVAAGDLANVKAAIDRQANPGMLPADVAVQVTQWSTTQDAWAVSAVPLSTLKPPPGAPDAPGIMGQNAFQKIESGAAGVKFGSNVVFSAQAQADTAQNASSMADVVKLLVNLAQMQAAQQNPQAAALAQSLVVTTQGNLLKISLSLPEDQFQQLIQSGPKHKRGEARKKAEIRM